MGVRRGWRAGTVCKTVVERLNRFKSYDSHHSIVAQRLEHSVVSREGTGSSPVDTATRKSKQTDDCINLENWRALKCLESSILSSSSKKPL